MHGRAVALVVLALVVVTSVRGQTPTPTCLDVPPQPAIEAGTVSYDRATIQWSESWARDFARYEVYRAKAADIVPATTTSGLAVLLVLLGAAALTAGVKRPKLAPFLLVGVAAVSALAPPRAGGEVPRNAECILPAAFEEIAIAPQVITTRFIDRGVEPEEWYRYAIRSITACGLCAQSEILPIHTLAQPSPTVTPTATISPTQTTRPSSTATATPSGTPTKRITATRTPTKTPTRKPTATPTRVKTATPTKTPTRTRTPTRTPNACACCASPGACAGHGGVNCAAGPDVDGSVICNDGTRNSSVPYNCRPC